MPTTHVGGVGGMGLLTPLLTLEQAFGKQFVGISAHPKTWVEG